MAAMSGERLAAGASGGGAAPICPAVHSSNAAPKANFEESFCDALTTNLLKGFLTGCKQVRGRFSVRQRSKRHKHMAYGTRLFTISWTQNGQIQLHLCKCYRRTAKAISRWVEAKYCDAKGGDQPQFPVVCPGMHSGGGTCLPRLWMTTTGTTTAGITASTPIMMAVPFPM